MIDIAVIARRPEADEAISNCRLLRPLRGLAMTFLTVFCLWPSLASASSTSEILSDIPVQHAGRVKPFETFAQEAILYVTGKSRFASKAPTDLVWEWMTAPEKWNAQPLIPVSHKTLREEFSPMLIKGRISPELALNHTPFLAKVEAALALRRKKEKLSFLDQKRIEIYERARFFQEVGEGSMPGWLAHPEDPRRGWFSFRDIAGTSGGEEIRQALSQLLVAYREMQIAEPVPSPEIASAASQPRNDGRGISSPPRNDVLGGTAKSNVIASPEGAKQSPSLKSLSRIGIAPVGQSASKKLQTAAVEFRNALDRWFEKRGLVLDQDLLGKEKIYNRLKPFSLAWKLYLASAILAVILSLPLGRRRISDHRSFAALRMTFIILFLAGFALHSFGFYLRCAIAGRPPVTNMYESIVWVSWAIGLFALVLVVGARRAVPLPILTTAALVASFALILAEGLPLALDPAISPLVPVLRSNLWLTVHVLTITLSYGAFALAWGLGHVTVFRFAMSNAEKGTGHTSDLSPFQGEHIGSPLPQYLYRALQIGVILLAAGTILGGVWASFSWGRFWGWDPKETWALIALLGYLTVLHGRYAGWLGPFGLAVGSVISFLGVVMAWYGVNFVLAAGLHSYGFGGGGVGYVAAVAAADLALIGCLTFIYKKRLDRVLKTW